MVHEIRKDVQEMNQMNFYQNELMHKKSVRYKVRQAKKQVRNEMAEEKENLKQFKKTFIDSSQRVGKAKKSLLALCEYLVNSLLDLPNEICQACKKKVFPKKCKNLEIYEINKKYQNVGKYPQRVSCGHWFHHQCLDKFITEPPFGKECEHCPGKIVRHPLWTDDVKVLEKMWAVQQAKARELDDVGDFLGGFS